MEWRQEGVIVVSPPAVEMQIGPNHYVERSGEPAEWVRGVMC